MKKLKLSDIQEKLNNANFSNLEKINISILRNIMVEPIEPFLKYFAYESGFNCNIKFGDYDNIFQEAVGGKAKILNKSTDILLVFMYLETISWSLTHNYSFLSNDQVNEEMDRIKQYISNIINGIKKQTDAMILWHSFDIPTNPNLGIFDSQISKGQVSSINKLNEFIRHKLNETTNSYIVNMNLCLSRVGASNFYDHRYWSIGRSPYTASALSEITIEDFKYIRALKGKNKKCIVLDCDNTLWGGIVGEDGLSGIKIGKDYPGYAFYEFQQEIINLYNRGIIIAICSKNNEDDVLEVFDKHPDMLLKERHIANFQINWDDKVANLKRISNDLNIGLDSMVFVDDSEFEVNLIQSELPEVEIIHLPIDEPTAYRNILASYGYFDTLTITDEDISRGLMYKAESKRNKLKIDITDMNEYFTSLEMVIGIDYVDEFNISRIAQLTQKTNQFNLTTRRYSESDIKNMVNNNDWDVIYLKLSDRFGDSGVVGACIINYDNDESIIDTFLLSCRVIGRGVEDAFLSEIINMQKMKKIKSIIGEYYKTKKNIQVEFFFKKNFFKEISTKGSNANRKFIFDLNNDIIENPSYFKKIESSIRK